MRKHFCPYCMSPVQEGEPCTVCGLTAGTYSPSPHHLPPGIILVDRYLVGRVLGEGGFGITYIGCDLRLELKVAIKEYFPSDKVTRHAQASLQVSNYTGALAGNYEQGKEKYLQEARTMARMNKQAEIVSVRDFFQANNTAYIVMEYVEGTTFKELVQQKGGRIPAGEFFHMIEPLFAALSVMHETGLIHRDISPDNLMMENGCVRLLDFGCARESANGTETMTIALKHGYAPIEQYQNKGQGPWTDVYGLCATMYYCLTGKVPQQSLDRLCEDELILPRKLGVDLTENQERALLFGMGIRPRRRYQSIQELYAALYTGVPAPKLETGQSLMFMPEIGQASAVDVQQAPAGRQALETDADTAVRRDAGAKDAQSEAGQAAYEPEQTQGAEGMAYSTPEETHPQESEPKKKWKADSRKLKIGAAAVGVACLLASPFLLRDKLYPASTDHIGTQPEAAEGESVQEPEADLFAEAVTVIDESENALREALEGDAKAVVWDGSGCIHLTGDPLALTKPLYIGENACIEIATELIVEDGGTIKLDGELSNRGFLRIKGSGLLAVEAGGRLNGPNSLFVEREENFTIADGGTAEIYGADFSQTGFDRSNYVVFSEEDVFAHALHVRTAQQLIDALNNSVSSIVIDEDLTLEESFRYMDKNVMVSEGVTLTAPREEEASVCFDGGYFVNYGTISGCFQVGDWNGDGRYSNVINYGQISNELFVESECNMINRGKMTLGSGWMRTGRLYNLGELVHDASRGDDTYLDLIGVTAANLGTVRMEGETSADKWVEMAFSARTEFCNQGVIEIGANCRLNNEGMITGYGQILAEASDYESEICNNGMIRLERAVSAGKAAALHAPEGVRFSNQGLIAYSQHCDINVSANLNAGGGAVVPFAWGDGGDDFCYASTADELKHALEDDACRTVVVAGESSITLDEELVVTKGLVVAWPSELCFTGGGLTFRGDQAYLYDGKLTMNGNALTASDGAVLDIEQISGGGSLYAETGGQIILRSHKEDSLVPGEEIVLESGGRVLSMSDCSLENRAVSVKAGSVFRILGDYEMTGCDIAIEEEGELLINTPVGLIGEHTVVANNGKLVVGAWDTCTLRGEITNNNSMECYVRLYLAADGKLTNNGNLYIDLGGESFTGNGTIQNNGTIHSPHDGLLKNFVGNCSGNKVVIDN